MKKIVQRMGEQIFLITYKLHRSLKERSDVIFDKNKNQQGLVVSGTALAITAGVAGAIALGGAIWGYFKVKGAVKAGSESFLESLVRGLGLFIIAIAQAIFDAATAFLTYVVSPAFTTHSITGDPIFQNVWKIVRDMGNMGIVLGFLAIAISTALRIRDYEAKKLLPWLIAVALLINFSGLFCGLIIDAAKITMNDLLKRGGASGTFNGIRDGVDQYIQTQLTGLPSSGGLPLSDPGRFLAACAALAVFLVIAAYTFAVLAILLAARYAILSALYILSPLAFVAWVFPATRSIWTNWWKHFIQWSFVGVTSSFFIFLAVSVLDASQKVGGGQLTLNDFFVCFIFLYIGYRLARGASAIGAGAVMGVAATVGMAALSGGSSLALKGSALAAKGGAAGKELFGRTQAGQKLNERSEAFATARNRLAESTGFAKMGYTSQEKAKRASEARKQVETLRTSTAAGDRGRYESLVRNGTGALGGAAVAVANDKNEFSKIMGHSVPNMQQRVAYANQFGFERKEFEEKTPRLVTDNGPKITETMGKVNPATGKNFTEPEAQREVLRQAHAGMSVNKVRDLHYSQHDDALYEDVSNRTFQRAGVEFSTDQITAAKNYMNGNTWKKRLADLKAQADAQKTAGNTAGYEQLMSQRRNIGKNISTIRSWNR